MPDFFAWSKTIHGEGVYFCHAVTRDQGESGNQPSLYRGTALSVYEKQSRAGLGLRSSMLCSERWEQKWVTLSKPEGWEVIIVGSPSRGESRRESKEEGSRVRKTMRNDSKILRAWLCHTGTKPVRWGEGFLKSEIHIFKAEHCKQWSTFYLEIWNVTSSLQWHFGDKMQLRFERSFCYSPCHFAEHP